MPSKFFSPHTSEDKIFKEIVACELKSKNILATLLSNDLVPGVRSRAAYALGRIGAQAETDTVVPFLATALIEDVDTSVRLSAADALTVMKEKAKAATPNLVYVLLNDQEPQVRINAAMALGNMGREAKNAVPNLTKALLNEKDSAVQWHITYAFSSIGAEAKEAVPALTEVLLSNIKPEVRSRAIDALNSIGAEAKNAEPNLREVLINDVDSGVRRSSAYALSSIKANPRITLSTLSNALFKEEDPIVRMAIADAMVAVGVEFQKRKSNLSDVDLKQSIQELRKSLDSTRKDRVNSVSDQQISTIQVLITTLQEELDSRWVNQWTKYFSLTWLAHAAFWLALIVAYPKSPQVQAIFFWNPKMRKYLGLFYVSLLLAWVPWLRQKLFEPFRVSLLADAGLDRFKPDRYFPDSEVCLKGTEDRRALTAVCPNLQGQRILEGDSGLGKTMFLRYLLQQSQRIAVYLPATKCAEGVIEAIQKKLHGDEIKDTQFLQSLIYSGAMDICIDGLNEVNPDTRAKITQFVESHFKGNILMTTQPLEWTPPATAKTYVMQPLRPDQMAAYLLSRQPVLSQSYPVQGEAYAHACRTFLTQTLGDQTTLSAEELKIARSILSNPMELTLAAAMIAGGQHPDLFNLREQQYKLMAAEYQQTWNRPFPLKKFAHAIYQQWLEDEKALPADTFYNELLGMEDEKFRMVISRQWQDAKGDAQKEWYFRHDKIAEFFLVQTFLGDEPDAEAKLVDHMGDPRFRGVYFLLATLLPLDAAQRLREDLIQYAADTKDHTVSDTFVQLLRSR